LPDNYQAITRHHIRGQGATTTGLLVCSTLPENAPSPNPGRGPPMTIAAQFFDQEMTRMICFPLFP
jgi:hypothetical protein